jgi:cobalt/nickel transport system permease protein
LKDRALLAAWAAAVLAASFVHDLRLLAAGLLLAALLAGRGAPRAAGRAALAVAVFCASVTLPWWLVALWRGDPPPDAAGTAVLRINLRAFLMTFLTLGVFARIDVRRLARRWRMLSVGATIVDAQIRLLRRLLADHRAAFEARTLGPASRSARLLHAAATAGALTTRAVRESDEIAAAMEARGLFRGGEGGP